MLDPEQREDQRGNPGARDDGAPRPPVNRRYTARKCSSGHRTGYGPGSRTDLSTQCFA
jgi:hypothetical protein